MGMTPAGRRRREGAEGANGGNSREPQIAENEASAPRVRFPAAHGDGEASCRCFQVRRRT